MNLQNFFTVWKAPEDNPIYIDNPLDDNNPFDISDWATDVSPSGTPIVKQNIRQPVQPVIIQNTPEIESTVQETPTEQRIDTPVAEQVSTPTTTKTRSTSTKHNLLENQKKAMDYFQNKGLKYHQAAGLVGNLMRESRLNPNARNKSSGALGLAQWLGSRKRRLISKYGNNPTFEQQLDFIWEELNSDYRTGLNKLRSSKTAKEAAINAFGWYEFSVGPEGAIAEMNKYGQNGRRSYNEGIKFAEDLLK